MRPHYSFWLHTRRDSFSRTRWCMVLTTWAWHVSSACGQNCPGKGGIAHLEAQKALQLHASPIPTPPPWRACCTSIEYGTVSSSCREAARTFFAHIPLSWSGHVSSTCGQNCPCKRDRPSYDPEDVCSCMRFPRRRHGERATDCMFVFMSQGGAQLAYLNLASPVGMRAELPVQTLDRSR